MPRFKIDQRLLVSPLPNDIHTKMMNNQELILKVPDGLSVNQALDNMNITLTQGVVALLDGQTIDLCQPLNGDVEVQLLPQIAGGD